MLMMVIYLWKYLWHKKNVSYREEPQLIPFIVSKWQVLVLEQKNLHKAKQSMADNLS